MIWSVKCLNYAEYYDSVRCPELLHHAETLRMRSGLTLAF
jgi:hypothetical protein